MLIIIECERKKEKNLYFRGREIQQMMLDDERG